MYLELNYLPSIHFLPDKRASCMNKPSVVQFHLKDYQNVDILWMWRIYGLIFVVYVIRAVLWECTMVHGLEIRVTTVQFNIINTPVSKGLCIDCLVTNNSWISATCFCSIVLINAKLQAQWMNLISRGKQIWKHYLILIKLNRHT